MAKITFTVENKDAQVKYGESILQAALKESIEIRHKCGGKGSCTTCKIKVSKQQEKLNLPTNIEKRLLGDVQLANGYRLACQTRIYGHVHVETIEDPLKALIRRQLEALKDKENDL